MEMPVLTAAGDKSQVAAHPGEAQASTEHKRQGRLRGCVVGCGCLLTRGHKWLSPSPEMLHQSLPSGFCHSAFCHQRAELL